MKDELEMQLERDFPFMKQNRSDNEKSIYKKWGCECGSGWYNLIHDLCQEITDRYERDNLPVDIVILQVKEKFAVLRFYYEYENAPCPLQAFDFIGNGTIRFTPDNDKEDNTVKKLRKDIAEIVRKYEEKSSSVCEVCGNSGKVRNDMPWIRTLCQNCYDKYIKKSEESKRKPKDSISKYIDNK